MLYEVITLIIYLVMGWLGLLALQPLLRALPLAAVVLLLAGGVFFTAGIAFYALTHKVRHAHGIWHRITSYNVCYTKLLRCGSSRAMVWAKT